MHRIRRITHIASGLILAAGIAAGMHAAPTARAAQAALTTNTPWAVILCKFKDQPQEPQTPAYFGKFFTEAGAGTGGLFDYWHDVSYGATSLSGSVVKGWYTEPYTLAEDQAIAASSTQSARTIRIQHCIDTARADPTAPFTVPDNFHVAVMLNAKVDSGATVAAGALCSTPSPGMSASRPMRWGTSITWTSRMTPR